jgi:hypothetical protein
MNSLNVPLPPELENYRDDLEYFVATMVRKLFTNRHKGDAKSLNPRMMLARAVTETDEALEALANKGQFELATECADVANFAFLAARGAWHMTRQEYEEIRSELG